jgi:hypothetical protein
MDWPAVAVGNDCEGLGGTFGSNRRKKSVSNDERHLLLQTVLSAPAYNEAGYKNSQKSQLRA